MAKGWIVWLITAAIFTAIGHFGMKLYWGHAVGLSLGAVLALIIISTLIVKFIHRKNPNAEENSYVLPDGVAKKMKLIDMQVQYEASIMATVFIILGMIAFTIYLIFFSALAGWYKFFISFNSFWGVIFLGSSLITTYQQYHYYMMSKKAVEDSQDLFHIPQPTESNMKGGKKT